MAAHNEGELLWRTVAACRETCADLEHEIIVADDASTDGCVELLVERFPDVIVHRHPRRLGPSPTKDLAARRSRGKILIFLDAHCKPEVGALRQLVSMVAETDGQAILVPSTVVLNGETWTNNLAEIGLGYQVDLENLQWSWLKPADLTRSGPFFESPTLIGCCLALTRSLYERLGGFDPDMFSWGVEDVELGVKSWMLGHPVLCEPRAIVGHRFQTGGFHYTVPNEHILANRLRMACKLFRPDVWPVWLDQFRAKQSASEWQAAWRIFLERRGSAEKERAYLLQHRVHDEFSYAARFRLRWPRHA
jgi:GT2 family glycosyltransferase